MTLRTCAFAVCALLTAFPTGAATACATAADIAARIERVNPDASVALVEGPAAARITAGIASVTGDEPAPGGDYLLAAAPGAALTYVVRIEGGCATHHGRFPSRLVEIWMNGQAAGLSHD